MKNLTVLFAAILMTFSVVACKETAPDTKGATEVKEEVKTIDPVDTTAKVEGEKPDTGIIVKETAK